MLNRLSRLESILARTDAGTLNIIARRGEIEQWGNDAYGPALVDVAATLDALRSGSGAVSAEVLEAVRSCCLRFHWVEPTTDAATLRSLEQHGDDVAAELVVMRFRESGFLASLVGGGA